MIKTSLSIVSVSLSKVYLLAHFISIHHHLRSLNDSSPNNHYKTYELPLHSRTSWHALTFAHSHLLNVLALYEGLTLQANPAPRISQEPSSEPNRFTLWTVWITTIITAPPFSGARRTCAVKNESSVENTTTKWIHKVKRNNLPPLESVTLCTGRCLVECGTVSLAKFNIIAFITVEFLTAHTAKASPFTIEITDTTKVLFA